MFLRHFPSSPFSSLSTSSFSLLSRPSSKQYTPNNLRHFFSLPTWTLPPLYLLGLTTLLYTHKAIMITLFQSKLIYVPYMPPLSRTEEYNLPPKIDSQTWTPLILRTEDNHTLKGYQITRTLSYRKGKGETKDQEECPVIVYLQGNAGNTVHREPIFERILNRVDNAVIIAVGYRGYGTSRGRPTEKGLQRDARAILEHVQMRYPRNPLFLHGHSLGGAVALYMAEELNKGRREKIGIILENTFTSIADLATAMFPQRYMPYRYLVHTTLLRNRWESSLRMRFLCSRNCRLDVRILFLCSERDEMIPRDMMEKLYQIAKEADKKERRCEVEWVMIPEELHDTAFMREEYGEAIEGFVKRRDKC